MYFYVSDCDSSVNLIYIILLTFVSTYFHLFVVRHHICTHISVPTYMYLYTCIRIYISAYVIRVYPSAYTFPHIFLVLSRPHMPSHICCMHWPIHICHPTYVINTYLSACYYLYIGAYYVHVHISAHIIKYVTMFPHIFICNPRLVLYVHNPCLTLSIILVVPQSSVHIWWSA